MTYKRKILAAAIIGFGMTGFGPAALSQVIDGTPCDPDGLGNPTCEKPDATRGEGVLWTAAEQAVSIVSAIADSRGCFSAGGGVNVDIEVDAAFSPDLHWAGSTDLGNFSFSTVERAYDDDQQDGLRRYDTAVMAAGTVLGATVSELAGSFYTDGAFSIMHGDAEFRYGSAELDEHLIKDFYEGIPVPPTFVDPITGAPVACNKSLFLAGGCIVDDPGDHNPNDPFESVRIIRDNGLEVTTKKFIVDDLTATNTLAKLEVGAPKGKWRQTSFYREANGPGNGHLTYTKVRIAPYGNPVCALRLDGEVRGTVDNPSFSGRITLFPLGI